MSMELPAVEEAHLKEELQKSARMGDRRTFLAVVRATDWAARTPEELLLAIDLALHQEMAALAIELAQLGKRLFPDHERIQQAARVLVPPVIRGVRSSHVRGLRASMEWLREHAKEYRGQWVAVREGQLLGTAESLKELVSLVGEEVSNTIVMHVT